MQVLLKLAQCRRPLKGRQRVKQIETDKIDRTLRTSPPMPLHGDTDIVNRQEFSPEW